MRHSGRSIIERPPNIARAWPLAPNCLQHGEFGFVGAWLLPHRQSFKGTDSLGKTPDDRVRHPLPSEQRESRVR